MQSDDSWRFVFFEIAKDRIPRHFLEVFPVFPLSEDVVPEPLGIVSAFGRFSYFKG